MNRLDKVKIKTSIKHIKNIDDTQFNETCLNEVIQKHQYNTNKESSLYIKIDYSNNELVIQFTGKILKDRYPELINKNNIRNCFENINKMGICELDIDSIIQDAEVMLCDVTKDVPYEDIKALENYIKANIVNYKNWIVEPYQKGIALRKICSTKNYAERIIIYDKGKKINMASERAFLNSLNDKKKVQSYFSNKIRFERNLTTMKKIRDAMNISDNSIMSVLESNSNPLLDVLDLALQKPSYKNDTAIITSLKDRKNDSFLKEYNYDLSAVEKEIRRLAPKNPSIKTQMEPLRELHHRIMNNKMPLFDARNLVMS
jgi:hypothetical protein